MTRTRLVLVHGTRVSRTQWDLPAYREVLAGLDVVTPDLPGHGARQGERFTTEGAVAAIREAVEGGDHAVPVVLAGHSLGGYMAMAYAGRHPGRIAGLALIGASAVPRGAGAAAYRGFASLIGQVGPERMARLSDRVLGRLAGPETLAAVMAGGASYDATADAWAAVMEDCHPDLLRKVTCPVLLVNGQFDQLGVHARRIAAMCSDSRVVVVPRASHLLPLTHPQVTAELLRDFAEQVASRADSGRGHQT
jgi:pimeloyl-ACP methyl ester carboxylesterase